MAGFPIASFCLNPYLGSRLGQWNKKKCIIVGCLIQTTTCTLFMASYYIDDMIWFAVYSGILRIIGGIGFTLALASCYAQGADYYINHVDEIIGYLEAAFGVSVAVLPAVGAGLYDLGGFTLPFLVIGLLGYPGVMLINHWIPTEMVGKNEIINPIGGVKAIVHEELNESEEEISPGEQPSLTRSKSSRVISPHSASVSVWRLMTDRAIFFATFNIIIAIGAMCFPGPSLTNFVKEEFGASATIVGLMPPVYAFVFVVFTLFAPRLIQATSTRSISALGAILSIFITLFFVPSTMLGFPQSIVFPFIGYAITGVACALTNIPLMSVIIDRGQIIYPNESLEDINGAASAILNQAIAGGTVIGTVMSGFFVQWFGYHNGYTYYAFIVAGYCVLLFLSGEGFDIIRELWQMRKTKKSQDYMSVGDKTSTLLDKDTSVMAVPNSP
eukprot:CAMPEP_0114998240 /NCGR_PEP_ID=MMETSP0216-20121206/15380_1 /TAXON_ID=223996 /ORGANISM="Protocruzia adherens, Strain Boccale" /LENGTH=441 /DNA_ID=CAMNT_0002362781 /DNA_START=160 /DNA_END=1485 /DNA_ORIENTATION=-